MTAAHEDPAREAARKKYELEFAASKLGTQNQHERFLEDLLPEDELLALARAELFRPFDEFKRWTKETRVYAKDIRHRGDCEERDFAGGSEAILYETCQAGELTHDEWEIYRRLGAARDRAALHPWLGGGRDVVIEPIAHFATCTVCEAEACRTSAKITIEWAGRKLVREYVLK